MPKRKPIVTPSPAAPKQAVQSPPSSPLDNDGLSPHSSTPHTPYFDDSPANHEGDSLDVSSEELGEEGEEDLSQLPPVELPKEVLELEKATEHEKLSSREEDYALIDQTRLDDDNKRNLAYKKLLSKYRNPIYNLIFKIVHDSNEVDDLVQDTFSKAFNSLAHFNKEYAFSTWLYRIATNSSIDYLRKRRLKTFSIDTPVKSKDDEYSIEIPDSSSEPGRNVIQGQRDALVREAITHLPSKYRTVIEMRHLYERSYEEIAEELNLPLGTVKAHIFRAREMLYKSLRDKLRNY